MRNFLLSLSLIGLSAPVLAADPKELLNGLIFHAPFDGSADANVAAGDGQIYTAASSRDPSQSQPGLNAQEVTIASGKGRFGDALHFLEKSKNMVFFYADENSGYRAENWNATISMWLSIDPADLQQNFADPIQMTDKRYNDAALWVDFTKDDIPPHFRMGIFADKNVWNPEDRKLNEIPEAEQPIVRVRQPFFGRNKWTHVVMTFSGFNTDGTNTTAKLYINGELQGSLKDRRQFFTWDRSKATIRLGLGYIGLIDELSIHNRTLSDIEVRELYRLPTGLRGVMQHGK